jgi:two-component system, response regulator / RNA-binding antiterminator
MGRTQQLRVLIANQRPDRLDLLAVVVGGLGHEVIAREIDVDEVAAVTARERPDVALVGLGESSEHALQLITEIVRGAFCPVIALLEAYDSAWIDRAAERGVYAYIVDSRPEELQSAIEITLRRFGEFQNVRGAFALRKAEVAQRNNSELARRRQLLAIHDGVVQQLAVAQLALGLDRADETRESLAAALENARAVVTQSLDELRGEGLTLEALLKDAAPPS